MGAITNPYFEFQSQTAEQELVDDLIIESIQMHGFAVYYVPRTIAVLNQVLLEDIMTKFEYAIPIEAYVKSSEGFDGQYELVSRFGLQQEKILTLTMSKTRWNQEYEAARANADHLKGYAFDAVRPMEGDLIYVPLFEKIFQIQRVRHEQVFYDLGALYTYDLICEVFDFSAETFVTGETDIDNILTSFDSNIGANVTSTNVELELISDINETVDELIGQMQDTSFNNPFINN